MLEQAQIDSVISNTKTANKSREAVLDILVTAEHFDFMYGEVRKLMTTADSWSAMQKLTREERVEKYTADDVEYYDVYATLRSWKHAATTTKKEPKKAIDRVMAIIEKNGFTTDEYDVIIAAAQLGRAKTQIAPAE